MIHRIARPEYLDWLVRWKEKQIIKVVSGVRRCGKSTLFEIYRDYLSANGVEDSQFIVLNFEDIEFEFIDNYKILYRYIAERLRPDKMNYIFLDEIQHVDEYEKAVDSLFLKENCDVYITGSNAYFLSGELATMLSGRYVELQMLPLSFREFSTGLKGTQREGLDFPPVHYLRGSLQRHYWKNWPACRQQNENTRPGKHCWRLVLPPVGWGWCWRGNSTRFCHYRRDGSCCKVGCCVGSFLDSCWHWMENGKAP